MAFCFLCLRRLQPQVVDKGEHLTQLVVIKGLELVEDLHDQRIALAHVKGRLPSCQEKLKGHSPGVRDGKGAIGRRHPPVLLPGAPGARLDCGLDEQPGLLEVSFNKPQAGFVCIIVDMSGVPYASSSGIAALVHLLKLARTRSGNLLLNHIQPRVREIPSLLGFLQFFTLTEAFGEAVAAFAPHCTSTAFPRVFGCPVCSTPLNAVKTGRFRCRECKTILLVDEATQVMAG
jgi:anti-anti-sigma factor